MKKGYTAILSLIALNIVITGTVIAFLPEEVALHFAMDGQVDSIGSKWWNVVWPIITALTGGFLYLVAKNAEPQNEKMTVRAGVGLVAFMNALTLFILVNQVMIDADGLSGTFTWEPPLGICLGLLISLIGNMLPKSNRNLAFGIRTPWSMGSDQAWQKTQRFAAYIFTAAGVLMAVFGMLLRGWAFIFEQI